MVFIPKQKRESDWLGLKKGVQKFPSPFQVEIDRMRGMRKCRVRGGGQRLMHTIWDKVWFGTEVWDEYGYDIL